MACLNYTLREYCDNNGNSSIDKFHLYKLLDESLDFQMKNFIWTSNFKNARWRKYFVTSENRLALFSMLYYAEKEF